jgi:anti-sigma regulatory factor (Ser/Thr protein kinase)
VLSVSPRLISEIRVPGGPLAPAEVRSHLELQLSEEVCEERLADLRLLATEVVSNSVRHGRVGPDGWVSAAVSHVDGTLRVEVRDSSLEGLPEPREPDYEEGGGFGLFLLDQMASRWGVERDPHLCVWFELPHEEAAAGFQAG